LYTKYNWVDFELEKTLNGNYCPCFNISYNEISIIVRNNKNIQTLEDIKKHFKCCNSCGNCCFDIQKIVEFYRKIT